MGKLERTVMNEIDRWSCHSNWSDTLPVDEEDEYRKIYQIRKGPFKTCRGSPVPATMSTTPSNPMKNMKQLKTWCWFHISPGQMGGGPGKLEQLRQSPI